MGSDTAAHEALLAASHGYEQFYEHELQAEGEPSLLHGFADWLIFPHEAPEYAGWTAERFRAEWERWNS